MPGTTAENAGALRAAPPAARAKRRATVRLLERLCTTEAPGAAALATLLVVAHPDDEVVSAGALLLRLARPLVLHVTDGAPRNLADAMAAGCTTRAEYAARRGAELNAAMALADVPARDRCALGLVDQEASRDLSTLALLIRNVVASRRPAAILTHPYEGGHPDHDATAFGVHMAHALLQRDGIRAPVLMEFSSYHGRDGRLVPARFLRRRGAASVEHRLDAETARAKRALLDCYPSQQRVLCQFPGDRECFRMAPAYDFTRAPHRGALYYEGFEWGVTGAEWRRRARAASRALLGEGAAMSRVE